MTLNHWEWQLFVEKGRVSSQMNFELKVKMISLRSEWDPARNTIHADFFFNHTRAMLSEVIFYYWTTHEEEPILK